MRRKRNMNIEIRGRLTAVGLTSLLLSAAAAAGCTNPDSSGAPDAGAVLGTQSGPGATGTGGTADAGSDLGIGDESEGEAGVVAALPFTPSNVSVFVPTSPPGDLIFSMETCSRPDVEIDTAKGTLSGCDAMATAFAYAKVTQSDTSLGELPAGLFLANHFAIQTGMTVTVTGNLPLIVLALSDANISGGLNVTSGSGGGAGASPAMGPGAGAASVAGSGSGGAGFCGRGGDGANNPGSGGKSYGAPTNSPLLGGSSGGVAFDGIGRGGGAVQIISATSIQVTAAGGISVGGGGGGWGANGSGFGGGGSGGAILLEAPTITIAGTLAANGGGGAGGEVGQDGQANATAARGEPRAGGGNGAAGMTIDGSPAMPPTGALSGGGGAVGRIRLNTTTGSAVIAPTSVISPAITTSCATQGSLK